MIKLNSILSRYFVEFRGVNYKPSPLNLLSRKLLTCAEKTFGRVWVDLSQLTTERRTNYRGSVEQASPMMRVVCAIIAFNPLGLCLLTVPGLLLRSFSKEQARNHLKVVEFVRIQSIIPESHSPTPPSLKVTAREGKKEIRQGEKELNPLDERPLDGVAPPLVEPTCVIPEDLMGASLKIEQKALAIRDLENMTYSEMDRNLKLSEYFGHIYVINGGGKERLEQIKKDLGEVGLSDTQFEPTPGVDPATIDKKIWSRMNPEYLKNKTEEELELILRQRTGCRLAQYDVIKDAQKNYNKWVKRLLEDNEKLAACQSDVEKEEVKRRMVLSSQKVREYSCVLILEDNNDFGYVQPDLSATRTGVGTQFREFMRDVPEDWEMINFQPWQMEPAKWMSKGVWKLNHSTMAKCYAVRASLYDDLLKAHSTIDLPGNDMLRRNDWVLASVQKTHPVYAPSPSISYRSSSPTLTEDCSSRARANIQHHIDWNGMDYWVKGDF